MAYSPGGGHGADNAKRTPSRLYHLYRNVGVVQITLGLIVVADHLRELRLGQSIRPSLRPDKAN